VSNRCLRNSFYFNIPVKSRNVDERVGTDRGVRNYVRLHLGGGVIVELLTMLIKVD
jgi:hypothetical protein